MSDFIVSARKYRPATFASVVGQQHITSTLRNAIVRGQLAHAYLFCGPRGVGKTTCARIFAKAINCECRPGEGATTPTGEQVRFMSQTEQKTGLFEACNGCESCRSFNEGRSLNIHELDAASNNSVEDIRTLIEQVRIIPQIGRYSVFIIDEVHMLSSAAFNAFLKTLEEPPAHAVFILATTEKHKIIPTILSRCQIYDFNRIRVEDGVGYLKYIAEQEGITADEESLNLIAQKADGGMRDALSMFDKAVSFCGTALQYKQVAQTLNVLDYDTYFSVTEMLLTGNYADVLVLFDTVLGRGFSGQTFMAGLNRHMRDLLMAKHPETLRLIEMTGTLLERYRTQAAACEVGFLFGAISILTELDGKIRQSSSQRLLVELGLMKIAGLGQKKNDSVTFGEYPLPPLTPRRATATSPSEDAANSAPAPPSGSSAPPLPAADSSVSDQHLAEHSSTQTAPAQSSAQSTPAPSPGIPQAPEPTRLCGNAAPAAQPPQPSARETPTPTAQPARPARTSLISGASISALMSASVDEAEELSGGETPDEPEAVQIDPACEEKLEAARPRILQLIQQKRPRFVAAFEEMEFLGNMIRVSVPTPALRDEILRTKTEMLMRVAEIAGVEGMIDLEVTVNEQIRAARPIKLEDRLKHMTGKNPLVTELRKALDLEVE